MQYNLKNKKILITGAAGGIGRAICQKFIENECILICTSTSLSKIEKLKNEFGTKHFYYKLDLSNTDEIKTNIKLITENHKNV